MVEMRVGIRDLRSHLTRYLEEAAAGHAILVTSRDVVIAEIRAPTTRERLPRKSGALKGKIRMAEDFDTWPSDIVETFEA